MNNRRNQKLIAGSGNDNTLGVCGCDGLEFMLQNEVFTWYTGKRQLNLLH